MKTISQLRIPAVVCASFALLLTACGGTDGGYYDANGTFIPTDTPYNMQKRGHAPLPGGNPNYREDPDYRYHAADNDYDAPRYTRRGYYDYNGYYIPKESGLNAPASMFPPRGMCRVWFVDRPVSDQPPTEPCAGIRSRVPAGAYVIYGG